MERLRQLEATHGNGFCLREPFWAPFPPLLRSRACERFEGSCDEFPGFRGSHLVIPVASDPAMDSARAGSAQVQPGGDGDA
jgi:hypothetical protein